MMNKLKAKLKKQGGFTLVEMLIVVAIIAILIAVSIPMISTTLEKARVGVDEANERSAMSMAEAYYLTNYEEGADNSVTLYYTVDKKTHQGEVVTGASAPTTNFDYGLSKATRNSASSAATGIPKGGGITVEIDSDGKITSVSWNGSAS